MVTQLTEHVKIRQEVSMNFKEAQIKKQELDNKAMMLSLALNKFPRGEMGLTPDDIKSSAAFKEARRAYQNAHEERADFNKWYVKQFKKELAQEREKKRFA